MPASTQGTAPQLRAAVISADPDLAKEVAFAVERGPQCTAESYDGISAFFERSGGSYDVVLADPESLRSLSEEKFQWLSRGHTVVLMVPEADIARVPRLIEQVDAILVRDRQLEVAGAVIYLAHHGYAVMPRGASAVPVADALRLRLIHHLTSREMAILALLGQGADNRTISSMLGISEASVKGHLRSLFRKLHVRNRTEAAILYTHMADKVPRYER
ncbi:two component transcriptional regulator, LuxR family [Limimonas halophila]|uniref:Two component transcriptional regulator, LuxR family n=1 Tax=Limimonas halophila TaxID=1082479 RepID=A0A1G7NS97_9PROT|nr:LuxR C-terminal-related transcriptional regulator [Limimonas halophila]SDF76823.1 two component transcriptional regulator, LuxR family [Limimonas halophila]